jgi:choline dehydrogenase-like flavoprotein
MVNRDEPVPSSENCEILVLGSGAAGKFFALTMAKAGHHRDCQ